MLDLNKKNDAKIHVDMPCSKCVRLEKSLEEDMGEELNAPDSGPGIGNDC